MQVQTLVGCLVSGDFFFLLFLFELSFLICKWGIIITVPSLMDCYRNSMGYVDERVLLTYVHMKALLV